jgi:hypothetical protein
MMAAENNDDDNSNNGSTWDNFLAWYYPYFQFDTHFQDRLYTSRVLTPHQLFYYRCVTFLYCFVLWWYVMISSFGDGTWFAYATNWTVLGSTAFFTLSTYISFEKYMNPTDLAEDAQRPLQERFLYQLTQVLFEMAYSLSCAVVLIYWITEFPNSESRSGEPLYRNIHVHGLILFFMLMETFLNRFCFIKPHGIFVFGVTFIYVLFNGLYKVACCSLYSVLPWDGIATVFVAIALILLVVGFFFSGLILFKIRETYINLNPVYAPPPANESIELSEIGSIPAQV